MPLGLTSLISPLLNPPPVLQLLGLCTAFSGEPNPFPIPIPVSTFLHTPTCARALLIQSAPGQSPLREGKALISLTALLSITLSLKCCLETEPVQGSSEDTPVRVSVYVCVYIYQSLSSSSLLSLSLSLTHSLTHTD